MYGLIGAVIGFLLFKSFFGAIIGFFIGNLLYKSKVLGGLGQNFNYNSKSISQEEFELNILSLSAFVIKADGVVRQEELNYVRQYFIKIYGEQKASVIFSKFKDISNDPNISLKNVCFKLNGIISYPTKLQLLHYLFGIANSDGSISQPEVNTLKSIGHYLQIRLTDFNSIMSMFFYSKSTNSKYSNLDNSYKILGIDKSASDIEVKNAYKKLAKLHHPDRVNHLGEDYVKQAEEKFTKIQNAYEAIKKHRGL